MKYVEMAPISRSEAEFIFQDGPPEMISTTLLRLAFHDPDWRWVQDVCLRFSNHADVWVRRNCITCFSHLARIHGKLEMEKIQPILDRAMADSEVRGYAEDTLEELKIFLRSKSE